MQQDLLKQTIESQEIASDPKNSAWVFASAGSGKTKILVDRLLRLLLSGVKGGKILCVTFTKVAALEMQDRINEVLQVWMSMKDDQLRPVIKELTGENASNEKIQLARSLFLKLMDSENAIKIVTIHSLCQDILKIFPFEIGISPNFEVMDQSKERLLLNQAKMAVFNLCNHDKDLENIVMEINSEISQEEYLKLLGKFLANKEKFLTLKRKFFNIDNIIDYLYKTLAIERGKKDENGFNSLKKEIDFSVISQILEEIVVQERKTKMDEKFYDVFKDFDKLDEESALVKIEDLFFKKDGKKRAKILSKKLEKWSEFAFDLQEKFEYFFDLLNSYIIASHNELILRFVDKILVKYQELKAQNSLLDYNDLIVKANELLEDEKYRDWVKYRLDGFYDHILIDESQDTNINQWNIIKAISEDFFAGDSGKDENRTIFVIGDNKQSIFGFQGANPNISDEQYEYYKNLSDNSENSIKKLSLHNSFRSLSKVLGFIDNIFANNDAFVRNNYQNHNPIRIGEGLVEVWPVFYEEESASQECFDFTDSFVKDLKRGEKDRNKLALAKHISDNILDWINSQRKIPKRSDGEKQSQIEYKDIMIVLRNQTNGFADILKQTFIESKIPFRGASRASFKDHLLLMDLLSIAKFTLFPIDDLNLAALLKSSFFRVKEDLLLQICNIKNDQDLSIFQALEIGAKKFLAKNGKILDDEFFEESLDEQAESIDLLDSADLNDLKLFHEIYCKLVKIIDSSKEFGIFEFYLNLIDEDILRHIKGEFGAVSDSLIDEFLLMIENITTQNDMNLQYFVDFIEKTNPEIKLELSNENSVVITTIHSAKGLQAPIVIVPDCCFNFNKMPSVTDNIIWAKINDENYGEFELPIWLARKKYCSKILERQMDYRKTRLKEEYLRLFYVALTRAENELYISGFGRDNDPDSWHNLSNFGNFGVI